MNDDIVTRLQTRQTHLLRALALDLAHQGNRAGSLVADNAADEIERLNQRIEELIVNDLIGEFDD